MTVKGGATIFCRVLAPPPPPDATILNYLNDREGGGGGAIIICMILAPPNDPPPPDDTILNYLNDRERGGAIMQDFNAPQCPPPTIPKYFTILMTEMRDSYFCRILAPPNAPPLP